MHRLLVTSVLFAAFCATASDARAAACADLVRLGRPATTVTTAHTVAAGAFKPPAAGGGRGGGAAAQLYLKLPAFCRVAATLAPSRDSDIKIEVWMPVAAWNGRFQAVGNGGMAGIIPYAAMAAALNAGYATAGTDTGHVGNNAEFIPGHPEKLVDFAYRAIHEMAAAAKAIIQTHYGGAPTFSYFNGCSQGGRQGITSAQRYPDDFDGIVAGAASWHSMRLAAARMAVNRFVNRTPQSAIPASKYPAIHSAVLSACDGTDGVKDGVIENPMACRFDFRSLACRGEDSSSCLTPPQIESAQAMVSPLKHPTTGAVLFEGHLWYGAELEWDTIGGPEPLTNAVRLLKNVAYAGDSTWNGSTFGAADVELAAQSDKGILRSDDANLKPFFDRGGKLLMWHGSGDPQVTPHNSTIYYTNVLKTVGRPAEDSIALFLLPGVYHCQGGPGPDTFDRMAALEQWVEQGRKPTRIIASKLQDGRVVRTRPLCPFGQVAKWNGSGSTDDAANFACVAESVNTNNR